MTRATLLVSLALMMLASPAAAQPSTDLLARVVWAQPEDELLDCYDDDPAEFDCYYHVEIWEDPPHGPSSMPSHEWSFRASPHGYFQVADDQGSRAIRVTIVREGVLEDFPILAYSTLSATTPAACRFAGAPRFLGASGVVTSAALSTALSLLGLAVAEFPSADLYDYNRDGFITSADLSGILSCQGARVPATFQLARHETCGLQSCADLIGEGIIVGGLTASTYKLLDDDPAQPNYFHGHWKLPEQILHLPQGPGCAGCPGGGGGGSGSGANAPLRWVEQ